MNDTPILKSPEEIEKNEGYQAMQSSRRPEWWGIDLELSRRPGVPMEKLPPAPLPNARPAIERMRAEPSVFMHGRPNKKFTPVYSTVLPPAGLAGALKKFAYSLPDHKPTHWLLLLLSDRIDSWTHHAKKYLPVALPLAAAAFFVTRSGSAQVKAKQRRVERPEVDPTAVPLPGDPALAH